MPEEINNETLLTSPNAATYGVVSGITFYKLESEFPGDATKNCSLTGEEVDRNFYFLRGYDIESLNITSGVLIIQRVEHEYEPIQVPVPYPDMVFDNTQGILTITYPNGEVVNLEGFLVDHGGGDDPEPIIYCAVKTDQTLVGDGTPTKILGISPMEKTGLYSPAHEYIDLTNTNDITLEPCTHGKGYRVVTKENVDTFGYMYPVDALEIIQNKLVEAESEWRIPTKADWDEMLNSFEAQPQYRNHSGLAETTGQYEYGLIAGVAFKTADYWLPASEYELGQDLCGMSVLPLGMVTEQSTGIIGENGKASFWCYPDNATDAFVKTFDYAFGGVHQYLPREGYKASIRLVKDNTDQSLSNVENLFGKNYRTTVVTSFYNDTNYSKTWLAVNFGDDDETLSGETTTYNAELEAIRNGHAFYMYEWDGDQWLKKELKNGETVVIIGEKDGKEVHAWRIKDGDLVDCDIMESEIPDWTDTINEIQESISAINDTIVVINNNIEIVSSTTVETISALDTERGDRMREDNDLRGLIDTLSASTPTSQSFNDLTNTVNSLSNDLDSLENTVHNLQPKVTDVEYTANWGEEKKLRLRFSDNSKSDGFVPEEFLKDTKIASMTLTQDNKLVTTMNDGTEFNVQFNNTTSGGGEYSVSADSTTFLHISDNKIGAYVDGNGGFVRTLATNVFANSAATVAQNNAKQYTDSSINSLSGSMVHYVDTKEIHLNHRIDENAAKIDIINGPLSQEGSMIRTIADQVDGMMIANDVIPPSPNWEPSGADSLLRKVPRGDQSVGEWAYYYASNKANDMLITPVGQDSSTLVNLQSYINELKTQVNQLQATVTAWENNFTARVQEVIRQTIVGTNFEIQVTWLDQYNQLQIGFTPDSVFGDPFARNPQNY